MINALKDLFIGTWLERPLRSVWKLAHGRSMPKDWESRILRDDRRVQALLREILTPTSTCIDIGAHRGLFLHSFLALAPEAQHVAVEALPRLGAWLQKRFPQVQVFRCALGNTTGVTSFFDVADAPGLSGLKPQETPIKSRAAKRIEVEIRRLDDLPLRGAPFEFVKIDVEGAEFEVFKGATQVISRDRPIILFEHARIHCMPYGVEPRMIHDLLHGLGYRILTLYGAGPLDPDEFTQICADSFASNYDLSAQTNFLACPTHKVSDLQEQCRKIAGAPSIQ